MARGDDSSIPKGRIRRTAQVGSVVGTEGARYAGTRAANIARSKEGRDAALERRHLEAAEKMVKTLGSMKGAALKIGQLASFIDTEFLPPEYRELYQKELSKLQTEAPSMPWKKVRKVLDEEWDEPVEELFEDFDHDASAAASIGQVHRAVLPDGRAVAVKVQYPGVADAVAADMQNAGMIMRLAKALAPGLDAKAAADELKERVLEELDYELEAQNQRAFARGYRGHPFIHVPDVVTRLSTERVLVSEWVEDGIKFDAGARAAPGRARPLRRDRVPLLLRLDLPPAALQRRRPPRQLPADARRQGRVHRLRHDQAPRQGPDRARDHRARGGLRRGPGAAAGRAARPRLPQQPARRSTPRC